MHSKNYLTTVLLSALIVLNYLPVSAGLMHSEGGLNVTFSQPFDAHMRNKHLWYQGANVVTGLLRGVISSHEATCRANPKDNAPKLRALGSFVRIVDALLFIASHPNADHTHDLGWLTFDMVDLTQCFTGLDAGTLLRKVLRIKPAEVAEGMVDPNEVSATSLREFTALLESLIGATSPLIAQDTPEKRRMTFIFRGLLSMSRHLCQKNDKLSKALMGANGIYILAKAFFGKFPDPSLFGRINRLRYNPLTHGVIFGNRDPITSCPICHEDFADADAISVHQCWHIAHTACVNNWLQSRQQQFLPGFCTVCKAPADHDNIMNVNINQLTKIHVAPVPVVPAPVVPVPVVPAPAAAQVPLANQQQVQAMQRMRMRQQQMPAAWLAESEDPV